MTNKRPIDPFARKMIVSSFLYGGMMLVMFAVLTVVYLHTHPRCSDRVVAESISADGRWTATLMERRCGKDTPFFAHINLRPAGQDLARGFFSGTSSEGEVFLLEQDVDGAGVALRWTGADRLTISCPRCSTALERKREVRWGDVMISCDAPPR